MTAFPRFAARFCALIKCPVLGLFVAAWSAAPSIASQTEPAQPWVGDPGITETTASIMERAAGYEGGDAEKESKHPRHRPRGHFNVQNLFLSQDSSGGPASSGDSGMSPSLSGLITGQSFTGGTLNDTLSFPPDSMGAAGPSQYIVAVNGLIRSFFKTSGLPDGVLNANPDVFFSSVMTPPVSQNFTSDPRIRYDRFSGRWFITIIDVPGGAGALPNRVLIAVSGSSVITPSTTWTFFQFQQDLVQPQSKTDNGKFADYPTLGVDANALYIGVNIFGTRGSGSLANTTGFVIRKSSILGAGPIVVTAFRELIGNGFQGGPRTPQGVDNADPNATEGYFIGVDSAYYGRLQLRRVSNPGGTPTISGNITIDTAPTGGTISVPHFGNANGASGNLDGLDYRLLGAQMRKGRLWITANIAVDNTGAPGATDTRMGVRWQELTGIASGQTPTVVQYGTLFQPSAANDTSQRSYWMGSIAVSGQGHAVLGFSAAGANERINAGYAGRLATDALGTLRTPVLYTTSTATYNPPGDPGSAKGRRWGDYSYTCVDPNDDMTMWTIQQWCQAPDNYALQVLKVFGPPPATINSATPNSITVGQSNVTISITGTSTDGSAFFDPGIGFSNHVNASVLGGGVVIHSTTYQNPTNLLVNLSVLPGATPGPRQIRVQNPDGQPTVSSSGLLTITSGQTNQPPVLTTISDQIVTEETTLSFQAAATDPEGTALTYSLDPGSPAGASVNPNSGAFTWVPNEAQGPATNTITLRVTDAGSPAQSTAQSFKVTVLESNRPPQLTTSADVVVHAGTLVVLTNTATDPDIPANSLSFSLTAGPAGATVDSSDGTLSWLTSEADVLTTNQIALTVTDDGAPALTETKTLFVIVLARPVIQTIASVAENVEVTWNSIPGNPYVLEFKTNVADAVWIALPPSVIASGTLTTATNAAPGDGPRFYRVRSLRSGN